MPLLALILLVSLVFFLSVFLFISGGVIQAVGESSGANRDINLPQQAGEAVKYQS